MGRLICENHQQRLGDVVLVANVGREIGWVGRLIVSEGYHQVLVFRIGYGRVPSVYVLFFPPPKLVRSYRIRFGGEPQPNA
jgi:hypothetical protein